MAKQNKDIPIQNDELEPQVSKKTTVAKKTATKPRKAKAKVAPTTTKSAKPKKKRQTWKQTMIEIITPLRGSDIELEKLIKKGIKANTPYSQYPRMVYRDIIKILSRSGYLTVEKQEDKSVLVRVKKFSIKK